MQLTLDKYFIIFRLQDKGNSLPKKFWKGNSGKEVAREEVAMMDDVDTWRDPILFSHTGFAYRTHSHILECSLDGSFGIMRSKILA